MINVSWHDAQEYLKWLSDKTGKAYRLLSEAQWEYAARAGTSTPFNTGQSINSAQANFNGEGTHGGRFKGENRKRTVEVGRFSANSYGLHDMHGNVWEWVQDVWHDGYPRAPDDGSAWTNGGESTRRVRRGGSWNGGSADLRSAHRVGGASGLRDDYAGFRVARDLSP